MNKYAMSGKLMHKASDHNTKRCEVEKWVFLPHSDFERLKANPYHNTKRCEVEKWVFLPHSDFERLKANPYQEHEAIRRYVFIRLVSHRQDALLCSWD